LFLNLGPGPTLFGNSSQDPSGEEEIPVKLQGALGRGFRLVTPSELKQGVCTLGVQLSRGRVANERINRVVQGVQPLR
jgi:hypothetical protein